MSSPTFTSTLRSLLNSPTSSPTVTPSEIAAAVSEIMAPTSTPPTPAQIGGFLSALKLTGLELDPEVIAAVATVMRNHALKVEFPANWNSDVPVVDIVGTGGDGHNTFNVSTAAGIVAAGAGSLVAKHGNRASSSQCGSADVLEALGCQLTNVTNTAVPEILSTSQFCFLFSQKFHPAMKFVAGPRKELGVRTIFNLLGPLTNPAKPSRVVVGVHSKSLGPLVASALHLTGVERGWVVNGSNGLDEISPEGITTVWEFGGSGEIAEKEIRPSDFGIMEHSLQSVKGGDSAFNGQIMTDLLSGKLSAGNPIFDWVTLNAAALIYLSEIHGVKDLKGALELAKDSIKSGKALESLEKFQKLTVDLGN
ncbi:anthranilate phosphoribosyltransferase [Nowakowskiella sp. JEL0407]|nr:anthranilate phosphoribosyltransferase [Nowakowskiella sp. JEL0407]